MHNVQIPLSVLSDAEPIQITFTKPAELDIHEAARLGELLFSVLYERCPSILLRSLENSLILNSPKIQELAEKANKWDDYYLQRYRREQEEERERERQ